MRVLVVNAGSSTLKLRLVGPAGELLAKLDETPSAEAGAIARFVEAHGADAVGHRIVHGGRELQAPALLDAEGVERLRGLADLAPLHNGPALRMVETMRALLPDTPHVACVDTAFHAGLPDAAALYALPGEWAERYGLRRFGFHGLSHAWA
jgi:acetate kinase